MALLKVNGVNLPEPTLFEVEVEPIGRFERNSNGNMVGDLIGTKVRLICEWAMIEDEFFRLIFNAILPHFVEVAFYDPHVGREVEKRMFLSPRGGGLVFEGDGKKWWRGVKVAFMER